MLVAVIGGKLQGLEVCYLAHKAGWEVLLIDKTDKKAPVPATHLCDRFVCLDVCALDEAGPVLDTVDLVIPALEDDAALAALKTWSQNSCVPYAFDLNAYTVSSSKLDSDRLFAKIGVPAPVPWPDCDFPLVAKPSAGSGSEGVAILEDMDALRRHQASAAGKWVLQEYVAGPTYSIEVLGFKGRYYPLQVTDLHMDAVYDCKRVSAPTELSSKQVTDFKRIAVQLAQALKLNGLMDVEAVLHDNTLKVLEIDARMPSQTPTAVYGSSGLNIVQLLGALFLGQGAPEAVAQEDLRGAVFEHIRVKPPVLAVCGEHIISSAKDLRIEHDFFGANEAITNYTPGCKEWVATLIFTDADYKSVWNKRQQTIHAIQKEFHLDTIQD